MVDAAGPRQDEPIPDATVARLPIYLRGLVELSDDGVSTVSSVVLASLAGVNAANVRKDMSYLHAHGTRGVGYEVDHLIGEISLALGGGVPSPVVIVGVGVFIVVRHTCRLRGNGRMLQQDLLDSRLKV